MSQSLVYIYFVSAFSLKPISYLDFKLLWLGTAKHSLVYNLFHTFNIPGHWCLVFRTALTYRTF